eukprot:gnl/MRDRNA2_/MRDRNA2_31919_c0_seq1.p1 gnl/MRDRNA2_/MRDRNA2_31919_c0~~gnl/MRDRNA2_/MRDRNA2_31919_c0_seq1.p1  ORF type:complete len:562 (-),score=106.72 gnl/MRDRNA2_/MRDRNA2_31919_c0_seq1:28-1650(-)
MAGYPALGSPGSRKRGMFSAPDAQSKRLAGLNPTYQQAFNTFDADRSGTIDINELAQCLSTIKQNVETGTAKQMMFPEQFSPYTIMWLVGQFGGSVIQFDQFAQMMQYIECVKEIFKKIDTDNTGDLDVSELSRALQESGFNVTGSGVGDPLSLSVAKQIGEAYDADGNGKLGFDEFLQLRFEWDNYLDAWEANTAPGSTHIAPQQTVACLEAIKKSMEPIASIAMNPILQQMNGFNAASYLGGLYYTSMFTKSHAFNPRTAEMLIMRFGAGNLYISFEQFCMMMEFLKAQKKKFKVIDTDGTGSLDVNELSNAFHANGIPLPPAAVVEIGKQYDQDNSGAIEFDEFLQMMIEWTQVSALQSQFGGYVGQKATPNELQQALGGILVFYTTVNGSIPSCRPFSLSTCRFLVSMFGSCLPGEHFPSGLTYPEFLACMQHVKMAAFKFSQSDLDQSGSISAAELQVALAKAGSPLPPNMVLRLMACYDYDRSGRIEFDEFLQMLLESQLLSRTLSSQPQLASIPGVQEVIYHAIYSMPRFLHR